MKSKKAPSPIQNTKGSKGKPEKPKLPPDPDGRFKKSASRARVIIAMYDSLTHGYERDELVAHILHDLMHLCDRDPTLGSFAESDAFAYHLYASLVEESEWMMG